MVDVDHVSDKEKQSETPTWLSTNQVVQDSSYPTSATASTNINVFKTHNTRSIGGSCIDFLKSLRPFRGIIRDIRARAPYYWSDWTDAWNYRVIPATLLIFFAKYDLFTILK